MLDPIQQAAVDRRRRRVRETAAWTAACLAVIALVLLWPLTNPWIVMAKLHVLGPKRVVSPLAATQERWAAVVRGVRSGEPEWLRIAARLRPVLEGYPGEQMLAAVMSAFEANPVGTVRLLVPAYGADLACGRDERGERLPAVLASERLARLEGQDPARSPEFEACARVLAQRLAAPAR